ncbi:hypothetical protein COTS27_01304 [Spirochaetota bacterium]|nr:hypothetical protein COTS27_01304 [Spirochaetota bacterium]
MNIFIHVIPYLSIIYLVFMAFRLGEGSSSHLPHVKNVWYQDFFSSSQISRHRNASNFSQAELPYYHYENTLAYISDSSIITHIIRGENNILFTPSKKFYLTSSKVGNTIHLYESSGIKKWSLQTLGVPHISPKGNIIMIATTDNTSITLYNQAREILLPQTFISSFITDFSFSAENDALVLGTIEGVSYYYKYLNDSLATWNIPQSRYTYIKSIEISKNANYIAILSGLEPERLTLYEVTEQGTTQNTTAPLQPKISEKWSILTDQATRKKNSMFIDEANEQLLDIRNQTLHIANLKNGKHLHQESMLSQEDHTIDYALFSSVPGFYAVATYQKEYTVLTVFTTQTHKPHWSYVYDNARPLNLEITLDNNYIAIMFTTHTAIYRYRLFY